MRAFLKKEGVRHVLLTGYNTDMCVCSTTAGYKNLAQDFDVFLVGDATIATFPGQSTPRFATTSSVCFAALNLDYITPRGNGRSWVRTATDGKSAGRSDGQAAANARLALNEIDSHRSEPDHDTGVDPLSHRIASFSTRLLTRRASLRPWSHGSDIACSKPTFATSSSSTRH